MGRKTFLTSGSVLIILTLIVAGCSWDIFGSGIDTPATYTGEVPCADCPGNLITLTLRSDSLFLMRRVYREADDGMDKALVEWGRWSRDAETRNLLLSGGDFLQHYKVVDGEHLLMLDPDGEPMGSDLNYTLTKSPDVDNFSDTLRMTGRYIYYADAGLYWDCRFETSFPVAQQGDNAILEAAYGRAVDLPRDTVLVAIEGHLARFPAIDREGLEERIVVDRLTGIWADATCQDTHPPITLEYTPWKVIGIDDRLVHVGVGQAEPYLRILPTENAVVGHTGCNRFRGGLRYTAEEITIVPTIHTRMACPPGVTLESEVLDALEDISRYVQRGDTLSLRDDARERMRLVTRRH